MKGQGKHRDRKKRRAGEFYKGKTTRRIKEDPPAFGLTYE
jgi:hypothetical protein